MNRLQHQWRRLYAAAPPARPSEPSDAADASGAAGPGGLPPSPPTAVDSALVDSAGQVRAMVLAVGRPADWALLAPLWQGVQADLGWTAPAIAVSGHDTLQLWFSLATPVPAAQALQVLQALRGRYLGALPAHRVAYWPAPGQGDGASVQHAEPVPAEQTGGGRWSAFVAPDLAAMFSGEPWIDLPPSPDGQARLLAGLASMPLTDLAAALALSELLPAAAQTADPVASPESGLAPIAGPAGLPPSAAPSHTPVDPLRFLRDVLSDTSAPLALRIEAAKALLPYSARPPGA